MKRLSGEFGFGAIRIFDKDPVKHQASFFKVAESCVGLANLKGRGGEFRARGV